DRGRHRRGGRDRLGVRTESPAFGTMADGGRLAPARAAGTVPARAAGCLRLLVVAGRTRLRDLHRRTRGGGDARRGGARQPLDQAVAAYGQPRVRGRGAVAAAVAGRRRGDRHAAAARLVAAADGAAHAAGGAGRDAAGAGLRGGGGGAWMSCGVAAMAPG